MKRKATRGRRTEDFGIRPVSWHGITASVLTAAEIVILTSAVFLSYLEQGKAGMAAGIMGIAVLMMSGAGIILSVVGLTKKRLNRSTCVLGLAGNLICLMFVLYLCLFA